MNNNKIQEIMEKISPLTDELSEICKEWTFELWNGTLKVKFKKKASEM